MGGPAELGWDFALPDWEARLKRGASLVPTLPLDEAAVARAVGIFNKLKLPDVINPLTGESPVLREAVGDWYRDIIAAIFGSVDDTGLRRVRNVLLVVPKKNSKTTNAAATMVTALLADRTPRQAYLLYGPTQEIAQRAFDQASGMIEADPVLKARLKPNANLKLIKDLKTGSTLKVQTFDESVATGAIPKGVLIDEIHILGKKPYASRVLGQLEGGMIARPDAFILKITTQSDQPPAGVWRANLILGRAIRDGKVTGPAASMLPVIFEFGEKFQRSRAWTDSKTWHQVLPNLGRSIRLDLLEADFATAQEKGEEEVRRWASQHLNIEIGLGLHDQRWRGADFWEAAGFEPIRDLDVLLARCEVAVVGLDAGGLDDLTGAAVIGRDKRTKMWLIWNHAWAHRKVLKLRPENAERLQDFERDGDLTFWGSADAVADVKTRLTEDGDEVEFLERPEAAGRDIEAIVGICVRVRDSGLMPEDGNILVDPASMGMILDALQAVEFTVPDQVEKDDGDIWAVSQTVMNMFSAINTLERMLEEGTAAHGGTAMMAWCVGNAKAELRGNAVAITKAQAGKAKIDPLVATFVAAKRMEQNPTAERASAYSGTRGLLTV